jgi:phenylalanyl-tRNA synthetase alpha chain
MITLQQQAQSIRNDFDQALHAVTSAQELESVRVHFTGRQGVLNGVMDQLKQLSVDDKRQFGPLLNELKQYIQQQLLDKQAYLEAQAEAARVAKVQHFDVTAYLPGGKKGSLHPYTHVLRQLEDVFVSMGYELVEGPELETEWYNFEALNIPANHPARDMQDTLWLDMPGKLMRTHTSSVQARFMQQRRPPFAVFAPGRCYRHEATDATHDYVFMQVEGLLVGENISLAHLLGQLKVFLAGLFEKQQVELRLRPSYFPFVEPGVEVDMQCPFCSSGCSTCKYSRWIEILGAGLVHPAVLEHFGIDTQKYAGFAFGLGLTRLTMLKYGIPDIRLLHTASLDFLRQF